LRVLAALLVVVYHAGTMARDYGVDPGPLFLMAESVGFAGVGVFCD